MYSGKELGGSRKYLICLVGLLTGILLFAGSFSLLLENSLFNGSFYKSAFERLDTYGKISELAGTPARELTERIAAPSSAQEDFSRQNGETGMEQQKTMLKTLVEDNVSDRMVRWNVDSLVDGLTSFFRGETGMLPDLHLSGSPLFENVNLQVLIMYMGESRISDIFRLICLAQYTLAHVPLLVILLIPLFAAPILSGTPEDGILWIRSTACSIWIAFMIVGFVFLLAPDYIAVETLPWFGSASGTIPSLILLHAGYISRMLAILALFTGIIPLIASETLNRFNKNKIRTGPVHLKYGLSRELPISKYHGKSGFALLITAILLFGTMADTIAVSSFHEFDRRNLGQSLSLLWNNNPLYPVINARNDLVYLLTVHMVEKGSNKPLSNIGITIIPENGSQNRFQKFSGLTDRNGNATFFLDKGQYCLTLDNGSRFVDGSPDTADIRQFAMEMPGKSVIYASLENRKGTSPHMLDMAFQFMP